MTRHTDTILILAGLAIICGMVLLRHGCTERADGGIVQQYPPVWAAQSGGTVVSNPDDYVVWYNFTGANGTNDAGTNRYNLIDGGGTTWSNNYVHFAGGYLNGPSNIFTKFPVITNIQLMTVACWIRCAAQDNKGLWTFDSKVNVYRNGAYNVYSFTNALEDRTPIAWPSSTTLRQHSSDWTPYTSGWHHVCITYNPTTALRQRIIYIDGTNMNSDNVFATNDFFDGTTAQIFLGYYHTTTFGMIGDMDDWKLWGRTLAPVEVTNLYNQGRSSP